MTWKKMRAYARVVKMSFEMTMRKNVMDSFILFGLLIQPLIVAMLALWMLQGKGGDYVIFVVVGSGMTGLWTSVLFISGNSITAERWTGTLEMLVGVPTPIQVVVFGKNLANVVQSLSSMVVSYVLAGLLFGYAPHVEQPVLFVISLFFAVIAYICFGLILAPAFVLNPNVQRWQNGMEFPVYILCGFLFPVTLLPGWTTPFSYLLAPYWAARALHETSSGGAGLEEVAFSWGMMIFFSILYLMISQQMFRRLVFRARVDATLSMQ